MWKYSRKKCHGCGIVGWNVLLQNLTFNYVRRLYKRTKQNQMCDLLIHLDIYSVETNTLIFSVFIGFVT